MRCLSDLCIYKYLYPIYLNMKNISRNKNKQKYRVKDILISGHLNKWPIKGFSLTFLHNGIHPLHFLWKKKKKDKKEKVIRIVTISVNHDCKRNTAYLVLHISSPFIRNGEL